MHAANAALPGPEREVLALLAESGLGYAGVGKLLGVAREDVAALAASARLRLAGAEVAEACRPQLPRLAGLIDDERVEAPPHAADCAGCAAALSAMQTADAAYRAWDPGPMPDHLRKRG